MGQSPDGVEFGHNGQFEKTDAAIMFRSKFAEFWMGAIEKEKRGPSQLSHLFNSPC